MGEEKIEAARTAESRDVPGIAVADRLGLRVQASDVEDEVIRLVQKPEFRNVSAVKGDSIGETGGGSASS